MLVNNRPVRNLKNSTTTFRLNCQLKGEQRLQGEIDRAANNLGMFEHMEKSLKAWLKNDSITDGSFMQIVIWSITLCCDPLAILLVMAASRRGR